MNNKKQQSIQKNRSLLLTELNIFRRNPEKIIPFLNIRKTNYSKTSKKILYSSHHPNKGLQTKQGCQPINQLIGQLYTKDLMPALIQNPQLSTLAQQLTSTFTDLLPSQITLTPEIGKFLRSRLSSSLSFTFPSKLTCLIGISFDKQQYQPLLSLLIDDNDLERKNRKCLLNQKYRWIGVGMGRLDKCEELKVAVYLVTEQIGVK